MGKKLFKLYLALFITFLSAFCIISNQNKQDTAVDSISVVHAATVSGSVIK